jgi:predicted deacetylase
MRSKFVIRLDDIAPGMNWEAMDRVARAFDALGIRPLLGVVPDNRDPGLDVGPPRVDFWERLRNWAGQGWSIAQHGYQHVYCTSDAGLLRINPRSEFAGLSYETQREKLSLGREILKAQGLATDVFMAPAHSFDRDTLRALADLGFTSVTDGYGLFPYRSEGLTFVPQLFSKPYHCGIGVYTVCLHLNTISGPALSDLEEFCRRRRADIVGFPEAAATRGPKRLNAVSGWLLGNGTRALRRIRLRIR